MRMTTREVQTTLQARIDTLFSEHPVVERPLDDETDPFWIKERITQIDHIIDALTELRHRDMGLLAECQADKTTADPWHGLTPEQRAMWIPKVPEVFQGLEGQVTILDDFSQVPNVELTFGEYKKVDKISGKPLDLDEGFSLVEDEVEAACNAEEKARGEGEYNHDDGVSIQKDPRGDPDCRQ